MRGKGGLVSGAWTAGETHGHQAPVAFRKSGPSGDALGDKIALFAFEAVCGPVWRLMHMGQAMRSVLRIRSASPCPRMSLGTAMDWLNDIVMVTEAEPTTSRAPGSSYVNPAFERITGYTSEEVIGRSPRFMQGKGTSAAEVQPGSSGLWRARSRSARSSSTTARTAPRSGSRSRPARRGARRPGGVLRGFIERDITAKKKAEAALLEQERAISTLFSNLPGMAYRCRGDGSWTMEFVSAGCRELTGYDPGGLHRQPLVELRGDHRAGGQEGGARKSSRAPRARGAFELTYRIRTREGGSSGSGSGAGPSPSRTAGSGTWRASSPTSPSASCSRTRSCRTSAWRASGPLRAASRTT
jgi:PAS domain S-box-containing protein